MAANFNLKNKAFRIAEEGYNVLQHLCLFT